LEHFCVKFGHSSCIGFSDIMCKNRQTHRQTDVKTLPNDCCQTG